MYLLRKLKSLSINMLLLGLGVTAYCYDVAAAGYMYGFISIITGIVAVLYMALPDDENILAKSMAKHKFEGYYLGDTANNIIWTIVILFPVSHGEIFYGLCWFMLWLVARSREDKIKYYYKEYVAGRLKPEEK